MTTTNSPRTYAEAVKVAETVTIEEFVRMIEADDAVEIYPGPRKARRAALFAKVYNADGSHPFVGFTYCNRNGFSEESGAATISRYSVPVFDFYNVGRIVKVAV